MTTTPRPGCEIFGHSYHDKTGECGYCPAVLPMPKPGFTVTFRSGKTRRYRTLNGAMRGRRPGSVVRTSKGYVVWGRG